MPLEIRELVPETSESDRDRLVPAFLEIWNAPENRPFLSFTQQPFGEDQVRGWFGAHIAAGIRYFGAFERPAHIAGLLVTRHDPIEGFELMALGVRPQTKRRGIGRALALHCLERAREAGYRLVEAQVFATNRAMLRLVLDIGFVPVRVEHNRGAEGEDLVHLRGPCRPREG